MPDDPEVGEERAPGRDREANPFTELLGGKGQALDASAPGVAFVAVWLVADALAWAQPILVGGIAAVVVAAGIAAWRLRRGDRPRAVAVGLLLAVGAALLALYTGRAEDFFLPRIVANAGSLVAWLVSIAIRWPLLGVVVGTLTGHPTLWRRDPDLVRGYCRASWVWVAQYALRVVVFLGLWWAEQPAALLVAQIVLTWPLVVVCIAASWPLVRSALPPGHPGPRRPVVPDA
ncbi:uncharacterized protein DUF3159 [Actinomycetospora succinea]|uniref:Uncharacterized protein DUF3159 n=1 Tax=Actinomycetospora succinea TaxID=663603 RepID=A0A4R6VHV6_9PSEU|nr:DUF3159 domain-containing protein [Actinomycetospora succinea]TDQ62827.1 uncharacterized protein DUF3159 [Actinomycetospora succinea]